MIEAVSTNKLFHEVLDGIPEETKKRIDWSFDISDRIDVRLRELGMSKVEFARKAGTSPAAVTRWIGGTHNFTLATLARISTILDIPLIQVVR